MDVPPHVLEQTFESDFRRGAILSTEMQFRDGTSRKKFIIVLNKHPADSDTLLFLTTSKIEFYNKYPTVDHIRIEANQLPCFSLTTVINCREVFPMKRSELKRRYRESLLKFEGCLSTAIMEQVDQRVVASRLISSRHKKAILGWQ